MSLHRQLYDKGNGSTMLRRTKMGIACAHLYDLTREELAYILDTFPIVRRKDEAKYGEYRTKRMVLEAYDLLAKAGQC